MLQVEFAQISHPGLVRDNNEDCLGCVLPENPEQARLRGWLFALADGVGGQDRGEIASRIAIERIAAEFRSSSPHESLTAVLPRLLQSANVSVFEAALTASPGGSSMATTLVACALRFDRVTVCHAGDSRCYLIRQNYALPLTRDHTISNEQARMGLLSSREAATAATAHILSRSLGTAMFLNADTSEHQVFAGDLLLLCSDGLHHSVLPGDIARLALQPDLHRAAEELVALANQRDGSDNISVQLIHIKSVERVGMYRGRQYKIQ